MNNVNQTLYIPLCGKACVSRKGVILHDPNAERIWEAEGFPLRGKAASKWLAYYMGMRAAVFDSWVREQMKRFPEAIVIHLGCGLDSRAERVERGEHLWYDVDFPAVIHVRRRYYEESSTYRMVAADIREEAWLKEIPAGCQAIVVMEGVSMYLAPEEYRALCASLRHRCGEISLLVDCYTQLGAKASKYKNPVQDVGVTRVYGVSDPEELAEGTGLSFVKEHEMTPQALIDELKGGEKFLFRHLYGGTVAGKLYRLYEYKSCV